MPSSNTAKDTTPTNTRLRERKSINLPALTLLLLIVLASIMFGHPS